LPVTLGAMRRILAALTLVVLAAGPACRRFDTRELDPVRALRGSVGPRFQPPADGLLTDAQVDMFLRVRKAAGRRPASEVAIETGIDPAEFAWVRARIAEALVALDAARVGDAAYETYGGALARLREARRATPDPRVASRLEAEIAGLERERATLRRSEAAAPASRNGVRIAARRGELERAGP
jgi:hypothetical protein